jgi:glucosamine-6-phosphate deaminase
MFHLDEYIGLSAGHPASFRGYLKERFIEKVPRLKDVYLVNGNADDPLAECRRLGEIIASHPMTLLFVGIGGHHLAR